MATRATHRFFSDRKKQSKVRQKFHERMSSLKGHAAMDYAFLLRAQSFVKRNGLEDNRNVMLALAELTSETMDIIRKQS